MFSFYCVAALEIPVSLQSTLADNSPRITNTTSRRSSAQLEVSSSSFVSSVSRSSSVSSEINVAVSLHMRQCVLPTLRRSDKWWQRAERTSCHFVVKYSKWCRSLISKAASSVAHLSVFCLSWSRTGSRTGFQCLSSCLYFFFLFCKLN